MIGVAAAGGFVGASTASAFRRSIAFTGGYALQLGLGNYALQCAFHGMGATGAVGNLEEGVFLVSLGGHNTISVSQCQGELLGGVSIESGDFVRCDEEVVSGG